MNPPFSACMYFTNLDPICGSGFVFLCQVISKDGEGVRVLRNKGLWK